MKIYKTRREADGAVVPIGSIVHTFRGEPVVFLGGVRPNEFALGGGRSGKIIVGSTFDDDDRREYYDMVCDLVVTSDDVDAPEPRAEHVWRAPVIVALILAAMVATFYVRGASASVNAANVSVTRIASVMHDVADVGRHVALYETLRIVQTLPACPTEDSDNCVWHADTRGNKHGQSFYVVNGTVYPLSVRS